jgi:long-subunit fatty acid transport protein
MKHIILLTILGTTAITQVQAQTPEDALRYGYTTQGATARNIATGGAMGSLGGDMSALFINPAGIALFKTNEVVFTPQFNRINNNAQYRGNDTSNNYSRGAFGNIGVIRSLVNPNQKDKIRNLTVGFGVNKTADFNNRIRFNALNNESSFSERYLEELIANNVTDPNVAANNYPYGSSLALNSFLIDTLRNGPNVIGYKSYADFRQGPLRQALTHNTRGGMYDIPLAVGINKNDKFYIGGSINFAILSYNSARTFEESDANNTIARFNSFSVTDNLSTNGAGIGLKMGVIYKPVEQVRLGFAVHSPTWYNLNDRYSVEMTTSSTVNGIQRQTSTDYNTTGEPDEFRYSYRTPLRLMASASYVFRVKKQRAFITADVEYVPYGSARFGVVNDDEEIPDPAAEQYFEDLNSLVKRQYQGAFNFRVGGEIKFNLLMLRAGFAHYGSPLDKNSVDRKTFNVRQGRTLISGGLGIRHKGVFVDLTYLHQLSREGIFPYRLENGSFSPAAINNTLGNVVVTIGFKF